MIKQLTYCSSVTQRERSYFRQLKVCSQRLECLWAQHYMLTNHFIMLSKPKHPRSLSHKGTKISRGHHSQREGRITSHLSIKDMLFSLIILYSKTPLIALILREAWEVILTSKVESLFSLCKGPTFISGRKQIGYRGVSLMLGCSVWHIYAFAFFPRGCTIFASGKGVDR